MFYLPGAEKHGCLGARGCQEVGAISYSGGGRMRDGQKSGKAEQSDGHDSGLQTEFAQCDLKERKCAAATTMPFIDDVTFDNSCDTSNAC